MKIGGTQISTQLQSSQSQPQATAKQAQTQTIGSQVQQALFNRPLPKKLNSNDYPDLKSLLKMLDRYRRKLTVMCGDNEDTYTIVLTDDTIAMIDQTGTIYMGATFLRGYAYEHAVLVGVLAHEIGHQPKRWQDYNTQRELDKEELERLCRHEETRADIFAGKALAEMNMSPEPLAQFLLSIETTPHPEYFPAADRAQVIRDAHAGRAYRASNRRKLFPEFDRAKSPAGHVAKC